jgi:osmotically-inducible protein OsmY
VTIGVKVDAIQVLRSIIGLGAGNAPAGTSAGSTPTGRSASSDVKPEDEQVTSVVAARLKPELRFKNVTAISADSVVTINGVVANDKDRSDMEAIVKATAGVKRVVNNVAVHSE